MDNIINGNRISGCVKMEGEIRIPFDDNNKEKQSKLAEKIIDAAKVDRINAVCEEDVSWIDNSPEFFLRFPNATKTQMKKYGEML